MRYAVLSDIHGNLQALRAVLAALRGEQVTGYLCLGDLVGYGPNPNECVQLVADLDPLCVAGNHDRLAVGALDPSRSGRLARETLTWTRRVLSEESRRFLRDLPSTADAAGGIRLAHGSPDDIEEYVETTVRARRLLDEQVDRHPAARVLALGHTHHAWAYSRRDGTVLRRATGTVSLAAGGPFLLNPGSVGQPRERRVRARYAVLDLDAATATFHAVRFDARGCADALRRAGLPARSYHLPPRLVDRARHAVRRLAARP